MFFRAYQPSFPLAELARKFVDDFIDGRVEILLGVLGMDVRAGHGEVDFDDILFRLRLVVHEDDMRSDNVVRDLFDVRNFFCDVGMDRASENQMAGAKVNLHNPVF